MTLISRKGSPSGNSTDSAERRSGSGFPKVAHVTLRPPSDDSLT